MPTAYSRIDENTNQTILFVAVFILFLIFIVCIVDLFLLKNHFVSGVFLVSLIIVNFKDYVFSDRLILKNNKAYRLDRERNEELYEIVENLCAIAGLPLPEIYSIDNSAINAFTIGMNPKKASIVFTRGVLERLDRSELEGVVSHELAHIQNNDIMLSTILAFLLGFIRSIVDLAKRLIDSLMEFISSGDSIESLIKMFFVSIFYSFILSMLLLVLLLSFIPVIEELIFYKISRKREFLADAEGVLFTRYPAGLRKALEKISLDSETLTTANSSTAHLYIASPFQDNLKSWWRKLFHSHPPIEKRIEVLKEMDEYGKMSYNKVKCK